MRRDQDPHLRPRLALVIAAEQAHSGRVNERTGARCADGRRVGIHHTFSLGVAANLTLKMFLLRQV